MRHVVGMMVVGLALVLGAQPAWAVRTQFHVAAESPAYGEKMGGMIGRGLLNVGTSFMDVLVTTVNETKAGPPLIGTVKGLAVGVGCGALRLGSGAVDLATFWVPGFNGFPVSDSYEDCLKAPEATALFPGQEPEPASLLSAAEPPTPPQETLAQTPEPATEASGPQRVWKK